MIERVPLLVQLSESSNLAALDNNFQDKSAALTSLRVLSQIGLGFGTMCENFNVGYTVRPWIQARDKQKLKKHFLFPQMTPSKLPTRLVKVTDGSDLNENLKVHDNDEK